MHRMSKVFTFDASHQLLGLPEGHQCGRLHGHTYKVEVVLAAETVTSEGWILDFGELRPLRDYIDTTLDHRHLNHILDFQPTAEKLAEHFFMELVGMLDVIITNEVRRNQVWVDYVRVSETANNWAEYS